MATPSTSLTVFFCLLFFSTLSSALDLPSIHDTNHDLFSESDKIPAAANTILLPSDKPGSEPETVIQSEHEASDSKISQPDAGTLESTEPSEAFDRVPFTMISFRPVNHHIPRRPLPLLRPGHRCHHNHQFKPWNPRLPRREIPYGNDMILNMEDRSFDAEPRGGVRQIPARWMRVRHVGPRFSREAGMERSEVMRRPHHHHHHHHHDHDQEGDHEDVGLMKRIRKFLNHF